MKLLLSLLGCFLSVFSFGQAVGSAGGFGGPSAIADFGALNAMNIKEKRVESSIIGTFYLEDDWGNGEVLLSNNLLVKDYPFKYDLKLNIMEFDIDGEIRVCPYHRIASFSIEEGSANRKFVNCKDYQDSEDAALIGFFEILLEEEGKLGLFSKREYSITEPTYNIQLDVGEKNSKINKKDVFFLLDGKTVKKVSKSKSESLALFGSNSEQIKKYMKKNKLKFSRKEDLVKIVAHANTL